MKDGIRVSVHVYLLRLIPACQPKRLLFLKRFQRQPLEHPEAKIVLLIVIL